MLNVYPKTWNVATQITPSTPGQQVNLIQTPTTVLRYSGYIETLRVKVDIDSLPEIPIPDLPITASRLEKLTAARDVEWGGQRKELDFRIQVSGGNIISMGRISLTNRNPFYQVDLLGIMGDDVAFGVGPNTIISAAIVDVGTGLLSGADLVTFFGVVREEYLPEIFSNLPYSWTVGNSSQVLLPANPNRLQATIVNAGDYDVFLAYGPIASLSSGITLKKQGGSYEINLSNPYRGAISAVSSAPTVVTGMEGIGSV